MIKNFMAIACVFFLFACATAQPEPEITQQDIVFEQPKPAPVRTIDIASTFSNENVVLFPLKGDINNKMDTLNRYRGVLDNTTAGGYTVFDPSVTVFAVGSNHVQRPSYLPEYSVPKHAAQYKEMDDVFPPAPMPIMTAPMPSAPQTILSQPLKPAPQPVKDRGGTRSPRMLTGY